MGASTRFHAAIYISYDVTLSVVDPAHPTLSHHTCAWSHHTLSHHTHTAVGADRVASVPPVGSSTRLRTASARDRLSAMCGACHSMCTGLMSLHCCMRAPWCAHHHGGGACACAGALPPALSAALQCTPSDTHAERSFEVSVYLEPCCVRMPSLTILSQSALNFRRSHGDLARVWPCRLAQQPLAEIRAHTDQRHTPPPMARSGRCDRNAHLSGSRRRRGQRAGAL